MWTYILSSFAAPATLATTSTSRNAAAALPSPAISLSADKETQEKTSSRAEVYAAAIMWSLAPRAPVCAPPPPPPTLAHVHTHSSAKRACAQFTGTFLPNWLMWSSEWAKEAPLGVNQEIMMTGWGGTKRGWFVGWLLRLTELCCWTLPSRAHVSALLPAHTPADVCITNTGRLLHTHTVANKPHSCYSTC